MRSFVTSGGGLLLGLIGIFTEQGCTRGAQYYLELGNRHFEQGKFADASLDYRKSISKNPNFGEAHYRLGLADMEQRDDRGAYGELSRAVELLPNRDDFRVRLADLCVRSYDASGDKPKVLYDQIVATADYLLKKNPNSFDGLRLRGSALAIDRRFDEALTQFRKANALRPLEPGIVLPMIQTLFLTNQGEADELGKRFLQAHKDYPPVYDVLVSHYMRSNRMADAEELLKNEAANLPGNASPQLQLATLYLRMHREADMVRTLNNLASNRKVFPQAHAMVGDFYAAIPRWDDASKEYEAGISSSPKDKLLYQKKLIKILIAQGQKDEALNRLNQLVKANPEDFDARGERAILLRESDDPKKLDLAISDLNILLNKNQKDEIAQYNIGLGYLAKGDLTSARAHLLESAKLRRNYFPPRLLLAEIAQKGRNYSETIRIANEVLAVDPRNSEARLWHAAGLIGNQSLERAGAELDALLREYPNSLNINLHMAVLETVEKKYRDAEARYLRFYVRGQKDLRPLEGLIQVYSQDHHFDKALQLLDQELKQSPNSQALHLLMAGTATQAGKLDLATNEYEWLRSKDPKSIQAYVSLGEMYQLKGDVNSALKSYEKAREFAPNDPRIIAIIAYLQQTTGGQNNQAIVNLRKQLALDPENTVAMNNLAFALADTGNDLDQALSLAEKAQKKAPSNAGIADTLGWVYTKKGLNDSAIQIFIGLVRKYPDDPTLRYHYAVALLQKGQTDEAKAEFVISLSKNPPKEMADKIKQILSKVG
jgi:tetratricopeptide (TPR) repeat protein